MRKTIGKYLNISFKKGLLFAVIIVIIIIYAQQYVAYNDVNKTLLNALYHAEKDLHFAEFIERKLSTLQQELEKVERQINRLMEVIPADLDLDKFKNDFNNSAHSIGVEINYLDGKIKSYNFYKETILEILIVGEVKPVTDLLERCFYGEGFKGFIGGNNLIIEDDNKFRIELFLISPNYSNDKLEIKGFSESEYCSEINKGNVWLWNFKYRLTETKVKLVSICEELKKHDSTVKEAKQMENRLNYIRKLLSELKKISDDYDSNNKRILTNLVKKIDA